MTKQLFFLISFFYLGVIHCQQPAAWTDKSRVLPDDLRKVPVAIFIQHSPNPNYPEPTVPEDKSKFKYVWRHATSMMSPDQDLEVVKVGSFIWYDETGWKRNAEYNKKKFANLFNCPKGILKKGERYTFEKNYRWGDQTYGGDALWYVFAKDKNGKIYKGMAILETESEVSNQK